MSNWECYLIRSLLEDNKTSESTYIGATNNVVRRLRAHNNNNKTIKRIGAKRTQGRTWVPIVTISGFIHNRACLSFESGWRRLSKRRNNTRFTALEMMIIDDNSINASSLRYIRDPKYSRILDLLYFTHNITILNEKFAINYDLRLPIIQPESLVIRTFLADWIKDLPWPPFVHIIQA